MFRNYFKIAWRNLWKNKVYSAINIAGLAIGLAVCIMIMLFVYYERSFDRFHTRNIYRLNEVQSFEGMKAPQKVGLTMFPMAPTMKNEFPEIKNFTRAYWVRKVQVGYLDKKIFYEQFLFVDSTFLQIFDFKLIKGDRRTALEKKNSVVLTKSSVQKLFGNEEALGKTIRTLGRDTTLYTVTGIAEDVPQNSQLQFDGLFSFNTIIQPDWMNMWGGNWLDTYFEIDPKANIAALEKKFPAYLKKYLTEGDNWKNYSLFLLPLTEVHAGAADIGLDYLNYKKFDKKYTKVFFIIAVIVLVIACINFMNLSTARSAERAKEVGIRKSIGALRSQLSFQFIGETILLSLIALVIAIILVELSLPYVNQLSQRQLSLPIFSEPLLLLSLIGGAIIVGLLSGLYPAGYLSSFQPVKVLKGSIQTGKNKSNFRNILVVAQFTSAIFLIIATVFALRQLSFMQQRDPGFSRDHVVNIRLDRITYRKFDLFKEKLLTNSSVLNVSAAQDELGSHMDQSGIEFIGDTGRRQLTSTRLIVDPDYLKLFKIPVIIGRNFSKEPSANGKEYIINESLAKELLKENPKKPYASLLGRQFGFNINDTLGTIVGIARDFNFNSMHHKIETMFIFNQKEWGFSMASVKVNAANANETIAFINSVWKDLYKDHPFEYHFLDEHFEDLYRADTQVSKIVGILATLAIIISCLGLFGLASYSAEKRVKEVGIRKVMGASVQNIVSLLSKHFLKLVLISNLIAWPIAYFAIKKWLEDFAYRIPVSIWVFIVAGIAAILIALATVSFQAIRAAVANPVKSLRTE